MVLEPVAGDVDVGGGPFGGTEVAVGFQLDGFDGIAAFDFGEFDGLEREVAGGIFGREEGKVGFVVDGNDLRGDAEIASGGFHFDVGCVCEEVRRGEDSARKNDGADGSSGGGILLRPRADEIEGLSGCVDAEDAGLNVCRGLCCALGPGVCRGGGFLWGRLCWGRRLGLFLLFAVLFGVGFLWCFDCCQRRGLLGLGARFGRGFRGDRSLEGGREEESSEGGAGFHGVGRGEGFERH